MSASEASAASSAPPRPKHDWYQTEANVVIEVRIKGLKEDQVEVEVNKQRNKQGTTLQ